MKLHYAPMSRAVRAAWALEELGLEYAVEIYQIGDPRMRTAEYRQIHPMGRVPVLEDGDVRIFESAAIVEYVNTRYGGGRLSPAPDAPNWPAYLQWLHYCEGMLGGLINNLTVENVFLPPEKRSEIHARRAAKLLHMSLAPLDQALTDQDYLAGTFSAADIMTGHATIMAEKREIDLSDYPAIRAYNARLFDRPALQRAWDLRAG